MTIENNSKGQLLLDPIILAKKAAADNFSRYNGGWVKSIIGLNKAKTDGYSLIGNFLKEGLQWLTPGLYLDCSKDGSRKHPTSTYTLFQLHSDGTVTALKTVEYSRDWAVKLWSAIQKAMVEEVEVKVEDSPLKNMSDDELIRELVRRGYLVTKDNILPTTEEPANASN